MRIKKVTSLLGVLLVLSVGLMTVQAAEQTNGQQNAQPQAAPNVPVQQPADKAQYKPISDVRHVVPPYDEQDNVNTKETKEVELESATPVSEKELVLEDSEKPAVSNDEKINTPSVDEEKETNTAVEETSAKSIEAEESAVNSLEEKAEPAENAKAEPVSVVEEEKPVSNTVEETPVEPAQENAVKSESDVVVQPVSSGDKVQAAEQEAAVQQAAITKTESGYEAIKNKLWCITFQLVWNTFMDKVTHGPVLLAGGNPPVANELNKKLYTSDLLNEDSYYATYGKINKSLKRKIERAIEQKFNETSDILDTINWGAKNSYLFYAMLKKDFNFETPFDKLTSAPFNGSTEKVKYFGVNQESERKLRKNVHVLFYNSPEEYAVKLTTKEKEDVILFRTDKKDNFEDLYLYVTQQDVSEKFAKEDSLMVPNFKIDKTISYDELCGKTIKGTNKIITQALQTIKFNMDNKGGTLKSEAALAIMRMSLAPQIGRKYHFDKEFVMFLKEEGKDKPYFAVRVENPEFLVKE